MSRSEIEKQLELEVIDEDTVRSKILWRPIFNPGVFGGQVIGLALNAALITVPDSYHTNSLHCYFILAATDTLPIEFKVERV